ncbi:hypothetical protein [Alicyclobacillus dauci]|uniref:Uncharacterized protein n=1 Tax=Alicyclobacillus dauci TaxID=1475485 RepID=A0ABY6Z0A2_9BACL|nr:hypothetical protein [Alicyclobacillus dauci]WAH36142.1 hypothetical protein NZD86_18110 [Alicyclobacillus dauci]
MLIKVVSLVAMAAMAGVLAMTVPTTFQLAKMDTGLSSSLHSTTQLVSIESSIIQKNKSLHSLIQTAHLMKAQLQVTDSVTAKLETNINTINHLNQQTLEINQSISKGANTSAQNLADIAASMSALYSATSSLSKTLQSLNGIVQGDTNNLSQMRDATAQMNSNVPGVLG